jgi:AcrR family transcriptional regulator
MTDTACKAPKLRADAARNRARLVEAARGLFLSGPPGAEVSLAQVAKAAEVGIGTLYRHFPTRLNLLEAVYHEEVDSLQRASEQLAQVYPPFEALKRWLEVFVDHVATKKHMFRELVEATGRDSALMTHWRADMTAAAQKMVGGAQDTGEVRTDITADDVLRLVGGWTMMPDFDRVATRRILEVVMDGLRAI